MADPSSRLLHRCRSLVTCVSLPSLACFFPPQVRQRPLSSLCPRAPNPTWSATAGWAAGEFGCPVLCPQPPPELAPGSRAPQKEDRVTPFSGTSELGGRFQRVWPEPVMLSSLHFTSRKSSLSLIWQGDWCQFSTQQPGNLGSQRSSFLDPQVIQLGKVGELGPVQELEISPLAWEVLPEGGSCGGIGRCFSTWQVPCVRELTSASGLPHCIIHIALPVLQ